MGSFDIVHRAINIKVTAELRSIVYAKRVGDAKDNNNMNFKKTWVDTE